MQAGFHRGRDWDGIFKAKLVNNAVNKGSLRKMDSASGTVTVMGYTETETGFTEIRHGPLGAELVVEGIDSVLSASNSEEMVDVHRDEEYASISPLVVNTCSF
jgi:hypothetical protein